MSQRRVIIYGWGWLAGGVVVGKYGCKIFIGCSKTKLFICHKGGHHLWVGVVGGMGGGGDWVGWFSILLPNFIRLL